MYTGVGGGIFRGNLCRGEIIREIFDGEKINLSTKKESDDKLSWFETVAKSHLAREEKVEQKRMKRPTLHREEGRVPN